MLGFMEAAGGWGCPDLPGWGRTGSRDREHSSDDHCRVALLFKPFVSKFLCNLIRWFRISHQFFFHNATKVWPERGLKVKFGWFWHFPSYHCVEVSLLGHLCSHLIRENIAYLFRFDVLTVWYTDWFAHSDTLYLKTSIGQAQWNGRPLLAPKNIWGCAMLLLQGQ